MAGVAGFEPAHGDTKNRCLTAWLHPNDALEKVTYISTAEKASDKLTFFTISFVTYSA